MTKLRSLALAGLTALTLGGCVHREEGCTEGLQVGILYVNNEPTRAIHITSPNNLYVHAEDRNGDGLFDFVKQSAYIDSTSPLRKYLFPEALETLYKKIKNGDPSVKCTK